MPTGGEVNLGFNGFYNGNAVFTNGSITIQGATNGAQIITCAASTNSATTRYGLNTGSLRWFIGKKNDNEGGGNTGSSFYVQALDDASGFIDEPINILRPAGGAIIFNRVTRLPVFTVATLPAGAVAGNRAFVSDALAPVFGAAVAAGGAVTVPVYYTGAAWFVG
jgi:hypothetical protein